MKREMVLGIIRHTLTFVGGIFITKGLIDESTLQTLIGSSITLIGTIWSIVIKK
jgi:hypothetical protein